MRPLKFRVWFQGQMHQVRGLFFNATGNMIGLARQTAPDTVEYVYGTELPLMQFVGLTDKHGTEVYKSDIVKSRAYPRYGSGPIVESIDVVEIEATGLLSPFCESVGYECETWVQEIIDGFEVIGNIYQHPDLLPKRGAS